MDNCPHCGELVGWVDFVLGGHMTKQCIAIKTEEQGD